MKKSILTITFDEKKKFGYELGNTENNEFEGMNALFELIEKLDEATDDFNDKKGSFNGYFAELLNVFRQKHDKRLSGAVKKSIDKKATTKENRRKPVEATRIIVKKQVEETFHIVSCQYERREG